MAHPHPRGDTERGTARDATAADGTAADGTAADGAPEGDTAAHGTAAHGTVTGDPAADGTAADGTAAHGTVTRDPAADGTAADDTAAHGTVTGDPAADGTAADDTARRRTAAYATARDRAIGACPAAETAPYRSIDPPLWAAPQADPRTLQLQVQAEGLINFTHDRSWNRPRIGPSRSTETDRTCSHCAFESTRSPVSPASSMTWNGNTRVTLLVMGTTVTTPRPKRAAVALARSLLTTIAGRRLSASLPRAGSRSISRTSPRRICEPVAHCALPRGSLPRGPPALPRCGVVPLQIGVPKEADGMPEGRRAGP